MFLGPSFTVYYHENFKYFLGIYSIGEKMFKIVLSKGKPLATTTGRVYYFKTSAEARKKAKKLGARGRGAKIVHVTIQRRTKNKGSGAGTLIKRSKVKRTKRTKKGKHKKVGRPKKARIGKKHRRSGRHKKASTWRHSEPGEGTFFM